MDNKELLELLLTTGYPVAYGKHSTDKNCPYMDYVLLYSNNVFGGNRVRGLVNRWQVNLYTKGKTKKAYCLSFMNLLSLNHVI